MGGGRRFGFGGRAEDEDEEEEDDDDDDGYEDESDDGRDYGDDGDEPLSASSTGSFPPPEAEGSRYQVEPEPGVYRALYA